VKPKAQGKHSDKSAQAWCDHLFVPLVNGGASCTSVVLLWMPCWHGLLQAWGKPGGDNDLVDKMKAGVPSIFVLPFRSFGS
jgi:hypothetical protein